MTQGVERGGQQRHDGRLVGIAEAGVPAADDEIELVAEDVVAPGEQGVQDEGGKPGGPGDVVAFPVGRLVHGAPHFSEA